MVGPGTWVFHYFIRHQAAATTTGIAFSVNHTGTVTSFVANARAVGGATVATKEASNQAVTGATLNLTVGGSARAKSATVNMGVTASVDVAGADMLTIIEGLMVVTVSGNIELYSASEVAAQTTVKQDSSLILQKIG